MPRSSPEASGEESAARLVGWRESRQKRSLAIDPRSAQGKPRSRPDLPVGPVPYDSESALLRDQVLAGARSLAGQMRALQERYDEEHWRLADTLEFLNVQSRDLQRELAAFGRLAESLQSIDAPLTVPGPTTRPSPVQGGVEWEAVTALQVRCLGAFEVRYQGHLIDLGTSHKGRLILKYLVARAPSRRASKELLAELFWADTPLDRSLSSLQAAVHQVRRAVERSDADLGSLPIIVFSSDHYALNQELKVRSDVELFRRRLAVARAADTQGDVENACQQYRSALEMYGGEFLPEERYEDWVAVERSALEADYLAVLTRLVQLYLQQGAYLAGLQCGHLLLKLDGTREDIHRDVMRCFSRLGQRSEALRQYRRCFDALQAELEIEPEEETTLLFDRLTRGETI